MKAARTGLWRKTVILNEREVEVLTWVARGKISAEIAQILGQTKRTVDFHTDNARGKLGAATRTEAAIKAASGKADRAVVPASSGLTLFLAAASVAALRDCRRSRRKSLGWKSNRQIDLCCNPLS